MRLRYRIKCYIFKSGHECRVRGKFTQVGIKKDDIQTFTMKKIRT